MALALSTWKSVANKGASSGARDEYKFRIVQSSVNSTTHTASYKVQFYILSHIWQLLIPYKCK